MENPPINGIVIFLVFIASLTLAFAGTASWLLLPIIVPAIAILIGNKDHKRLAATKAFYESALTHLKGAYVARYGVLECDNSIQCLRLEDIFINDKNWLSITYTAIFWDHSISDDYSFKFSSYAREIYLLNLSSERAKKLSTIKSVCEHIQDYFNKENMSFFDNSSLEGDICAVMFLNLPEAQWASSAIAEMQAALDPIKDTYNASLTNELLQGNSDYLLKTISQLEDEISSLSQYAHDACIAIQKVYEFLSVPSSLRNFEQLNIKPLCIYSKSDEMRNNFNSVIAAKNEYDKLKS